MSKIRLDKFLAANGFGTRSEVKKMLRQGLVTVNGFPVKLPEQKVDDTEDLVAVDGQAIRYEPFLCLMFHKPAGCVTATEDGRHRTVMDYIDHPRRGELFPVGRLDLDTEGLLLLMNDGDLAHRLLSPRHHAEKTYYAKVNGQLPDTLVQQFAEGIDIGEKQLTLPARLRILHSGDCSEAELTITEGKFHQVKRMFAAVGTEVTYLKRIRMAGLSLDEQLEPGQWRSLTEDEAALLRRIQKA